MGRQVVGAVRQSDGDGHTDGCSGALYRQFEGDRWLDGLVDMVDVQSDNEGQPDGRGRMVYRWSYGDGWSDGWITGLTGGVAD